MRLAGRDDLRGRTDRGPRSARPGPRRCRGGSTSWSSAGSALEAVRAPAVHCRTLSPEEPGRHGGIRVMVKDEQAPRWLTALVRVGAAAGAVSAVLGLVFLLFPTLQPRPTESPGKRAVTLSEPELEHRGHPSRACSCRTTSKPSMPGSWMSSSTTSGSSASTADRADGPSAATPTTSNPSSSSSVRAELRKSAWSSTISRLQTTVPSSQHRGAPASGLSLYPRDPPMCPSSGARRSRGTRSYERGKCIRSLVPSPSGASTLKRLARCPISDNPMPRPGLSWCGRMPQP